MERIKNIEEIFIFYIPAFAVIEKYNRAGNERPDARDRLPVKHKKRKKQNNRKNAVSAHYIKRGYEQNAIPCVIARYCKRRGGRGSRTEYSDRNVFCAAALCGICAAHCAQPQKERKKDVLRAEIKRERARGHRIASEKDHVKRQLGNKRKKKEHACVFGAVFRVIKALRKQKAKKREGNGAYPLKDAFIKQRQRAVAFRRDKWRGVFDKRKYYRLAYVIDEHGDNSNIFQRRTA